MDDDSELHFALHNTYCAEHGKRLSECIPCSRIAVNAALAAEREACANTVHETLKFQSCMCCQRAMNAIRARRTP
jgi:hypothetical protein